MSPENTSTPSPATTDGRTVDPGPAATDPGGAYRAVAVFLALIVMAALVYGLILTAIKASALFTNL